MRIIKTNTKKYDNFYHRLPSVSRAGKNAPVLYNPNNNEVSLGFHNEQKNDVLADVLSFIAQVKPLTSNDDIIAAFSSSLKKYLNIKDLNIFSFDQSRFKLLPVHKIANNHLLNYVNNAYKEGILEWVMESGKPKIVPDTTNYLNTKARINIVLVPVEIKNGISGVIAIHTTNEFIPEENGINDFLKVAIEILLPKIELNKKQQELISAYHELQVYQSKLSNDFKLSAIGELTFGIVEDILSSLQIIMASTDFLNKDSDPEAVTSIQAQVNKIKAVISRLVKFSDVSDNKVYIQPCNLNNLINDFCSVVLPSVKKVNYELITDLEKELSPVLSHPNYLNQMLANILTLFKPVNKEGGIIIQTRNIKEKVLLRVVTTDQINVSDAKVNNKMTLSIIDKLIKKHEGEYKIVTDKTLGTTFTLTFPLKRRIRQ